MTRKQAILACLIAPFTRMPSFGQKEFTFIPPNATAVSYKPKNNQCPLCGTMAGPYSLRKATDMLNSLGPCMGSRGSTACYPATPEQQPKRVQVEGGCRHCGAAFWQDAEDQK